MTKEAMYYEKLNSNTVRCNLCPHYCKISDEKIGLCLARRNSKGILYAENYAKITSISLDPIEKKPLSFYMPGSKILSIGTFGCNFKCPFCQNYSISQQEAANVEIVPEFIVNKAIEEQKNGNIGIAYTYNEPIIWYEYVLETSKIAKREDLKNVLVTNGYINEEPLKELLPYIDAMNIDLKAFNNNFYKKLCKGTLEEVKKTIVLSAKKCHIELTTLIIPNENDDLNEIEDMLKWISEISRDIPLHFSRYFPNYLYNKEPSTSVDLLYEIKRLGEKYLNNIILGNI
jgi:pyruvate formate lyase activating enzyme